MKERFFMQKRYQYCMSGMFAATDQNHYEINIPSPHTYETEEEAMADGAFGYRFVLLPGGKGPQVVIFEGSGFRLVCDGKENYIKDWVEGDIVGIYDFDEFTKAGGYIRLLNPELGDNVCIIEDSDFLDTDKTFADIFPNMEHLKLYYIDNLAYSIDEITEGDINNGKNRRNIDH